MPSLSLQYTIDRWCARSSLKSSVLRFDQTRSDSRTKALQTNTSKRNQNMYLCHFFDGYPEQNKKNEADQHNPRRPCEKCKHLKLKLSGSSLAVELLSLLLSSDSLSPLSSLENSCTSMSDKSASTFTSLKLKLLLLSSSEPKIALIRRRPY